MKLKVFIVLSLLSLLIVASCDSESTPKYLEFASDVLLPQAPIGESYDFTFAVTYGEDRWDANTGFIESEIIWGFDNWKLNGADMSAGPANLTFSEGQITGTPDIADAGLWSFSVTIQKGKKIVIETFYLPISQNVEIMTDSVLPYATTDIDYSTYLNAKYGNDPYYWSYGNWTKNGTPVNDAPVGLTFNGAGYIIGKADTSEVGQWTFDATVYDTSIPTQLVDTKTFELEIHLKLDVPGNYATIQAAVNAANAVDTVYLADGTYQGDGNRDVDFLGKSITILGNSLDPAQVIIDCEGTFADPHRAFFLGNSEKDCVVDGVTITKGQASKISSHHRGGAIYCGSNTSMTIQNSVFKENHTDSQTENIYGSVIYVESNSIVDVMNCMFDANKATTQGSSDYIYGTIMYGNSNSKVTIEDCEIKYTEATAYYYISGGEFYFNSSEYSMKNVNIHHGKYVLTYYRYIRGGYIYSNSASGTLENVYMGNAYMNMPYSSSYPYYYGPILYMSSSTIKATNCSFANNVMEYTGTYSYFRPYGMFYLVSGSSTFTDCIVANNMFKTTRSCYYYGIIAYLSSQSANFTRCHFIKNVANQTNYSTSSSYSYAGGGIKVYSSSSATFNECVFSYNESRGGAGAISASNSSATTVINNSTFFKNTGYYGGAIFSYGDMFINNSVIWGNTATYSGSSIYVYSSSYAPQLTNSLYSSSGIYGTIYPTSCVTSDPYFKDTGDNAVTGDCTFSDTTMTVLGTPGTSAFISELMRGDMIYLTSDGETHGLIITKVVSDSELEVAGYYTGTPGTGAATVKKMDFTPQHTNKGDANDSPCVDSGDNSKAGSSVDIAGNTRIVDGNGNSTPTVDMGAYELQ